jgi:hypothetical protein
MGANSSGVGPAAYGIVIGRGRRSEERRASSAADAERAVRLGFSGKLLIQTIWLLGVGQDFVISYGDPTTRKLSQTSG